MKLTAYILVMLGLSVSAHAYDDYRYQKLADCTSEDGSIRVVVETAPAYTALIKLYNDRGEESAVLKGDYSLDDEGSARTLRFRSSKKLEDGQSALSGYVEYCGTYCGQDKGTLTAGTIKTDLNCKKLF